MQDRNNTQILLKYDKNNVDLQEKYKTLKKQVKKSLQTAKLEQYNWKFEDERGNTAATWCTVRQLVPSDISKTWSLLM